MFRVLLIAAVTAIAGMLFLSKRAPSSPRVPDLKNAVDQARLLQDASERERSLTSRAEEENRKWSERRAAHDADIMRRVAEDSQDRDGPPPGPAAADALIRERAKRDMKEGSAAQRYKKLLQN